MQREPQPARLRRLRPGRGRRLLRLVPLALALFLFLPAAAAAECGEEHAWEAAARSAEVVGKDWAAVFAVYDRYDRCDDPKIVGTLHRLMVTTLIQRWDKLEQLHAWSPEKTELVGVVLAELNFAPPEDRAKVQHLATARCPPAQKALCKRITVMLEDGGLGFEQLAEFCRGATGVITRTGSWNDLYASWLKYWRCDDGEYAESFDHAVNSLLLERWNRLGELMRITAADPQFREWVLDYGSSGLDDEVAYKKVLEQATRRCPKVHQPFCDELARRIRELHLEEQD